MIHERHTLRLPRVVNVLPQLFNLQTHISLLSCVFMCCVTFPFCGKAFPH
jgi:sulfite reductase beta subunit-like hemoprotein